jgi:inner membrane protein
METVVPNVWQKTKLLVKGLLIGALVLLLLIPAYFVQDLVKEREARQKEAYAEVSGKWAGRQNITGPVLVLPYTAGPGLTRLAYFIPDTLTMEVDVTPEERHRGIYQVMLYSSVTRVQGRFSPVALKQLDLKPEDVLWDQAYLCMGLGDSKGLNEIKFTWNNAEASVNAGSINNAVVRDGFGANVAASPDQSFNFLVTISMNGSEQLLFTPLAKKSKVVLTSAWPDPSFTGSQLPDHRITNKGFVATWKNPANTRNFPAAWKGDGTVVTQPTAFGADIFIPVNGYQKTLRSVKYAILCILLTFAAFFIIETVSKRSVHPFQYALIGLALILFYTLLLSFSEYTGFNTAYIIASIATVALIAWYVKGILQSTRLSTVLGTVLVLMYSYVFTILQLQDYSLLLGSIGLFLTLGVIMYFSRKIQW